MLRLNSDQLENRVVDSFLELVNILAVVGICTYASIDSLPF